jgi:small subunit ribosomal protein S17
MTTGAPQSTPAATAARRRRPRQVGRVTSLAGAKSVVVQVDRRVAHGQYGKIVSRKSTFMAHDEHGRCGLGDLVEIVSSRPLSARKRWRVCRILQAGAAVAEAEPST